MGLEQTVSNLIYYPLKMCNFTDANCLALATHHQSGLMKLLLLDNYDSFTYNLVHLIEKVTDFPVDVHRNDKITLDAVEAYDRIILSPGPGLPKDAGIMPELIQRFHTTKSIFGVCLGMQAIGEFYGAALKNLDTVIHGQAMPVLTQQKGMFAHCPHEFLVGRYHSWVVDTTNLPQSLEVTAVDASGQIMALQHTVHKVSGVQFHPESILSHYGEQIFKNWLAK